MLLVAKVAACIEASSHKIYRLRHHATLLSSQHGVVSVSMSLIYLKRGFIRCERSCFKVVLHMLLGLKYHSHALLWPAKSNLDILTVPHFRQLSTHHIMWQYLTLHCTAFHCRTLLLSFIVLHPASSAFPTCQQMLGPVTDDSFCLGSNGACGSV